MEKVNGLDQLINNTLEGVNFCGPLKEVGGSETTFIFGFDHAKARKIVTEAINAAARQEAFQALIKRWRSDANQYQKQVDEARQKNLPHDQMLSAVTFLRGCAKELEDVIK